METKVNYAVVGLFVVILAFGFIAGVLWLASGGALQKKYDLYLAIENESVSGLNINAPIKYHGVDIGKVRDIQLDSENPEHVRLTLAIERGTPIKQDTFAVLRTQGLTGIAYVELGGGTPNAPSLIPSSGYEYPVIATRPSLGARLENVLTSVLANLDRTSANINALLDDENRAALKSTLKDISALARTVAARKDTLDRGIVAAANTFGHTEQATDKLQPLLDRVGRSAAAIETMANEVARTSATTGKTVAAVGGDLTRVTAETLPEVERLLGELRILSASLRRLVEQTEGNPAGLLFGKRPVPAGPGE